MHKRGWYKNKNNIKLTWEPSGLLLPAGPEGRPFTIIGVLLAMLVATDKELVRCSLSGRKSVVAPCEFKSRLAVQVGDRCDGLRFYKDHDLKSVAEWETVTFTQQCEKWRKKNMKKADLSKPSRVHLELSCWRFTHMIETYDEVFFFLKKVKEWDVLMLTLSCMNYDTSFF